MPSKKFIYDYSALQELMEKENISVTDLAEKLTVSTTSLIRKLNSQADFTQNEIIKIVQFLHIPPQEISRYFFTVDRERRAEKGSGRQ